MRATFRQILLWSWLGATAWAIDLNREIILTPERGTTSWDGEIRHWQARAGEFEPRPEVFERLGWAFVAKARLTLDAGYYKLAEATAEVMDARFGASAESRLLRGHVLHNLHRFHDAEEIARQLVRERGTPMDYALLSDALMEQGKLIDAVSACQRLVDLRPGVEAYTRIAHLRRLKGDLAGARAMLELALRTGSTRDTENKAWILTQLSGYSLLAGEEARALALAENAIQQAPEYPAAILARGRALLALGRNVEAVAALRQAVRLNPLPEYQWWFADALRAVGDSDEAAKAELEIKLRGESGDPRTLALFLATHGEQPAKAVQLVREELTNREDVFTHDALAWALVAAGDGEAAGREIRAALAERTQDARLLWHAGEIALLNGDWESAQNYFAAAQPFASALMPGERARLAARQVGAGSMVQAR